MKILYTHIILIMTAILMFAGCGKVMKGKERAEKGIADFHALYNAEQFSEIYNSAHADFRKTTSAEKLGELLGAIYTKLGKVATTRNINWNINQFNLTTRVVLVQETTFEDGTGTETFTFVLNDDKAVLLGYNINSTDLIIK